MTFFIICSSFFERGVINKFGKTDIHQETGPRSWGCTAFSVHVAFHFLLESASWMACEREFALIVRNGGHSASHDIRHCADIQKVRRCPEREGYTWIKVQSYGLGYG